MEKQWRSIEEYKSGKHSIEEPVAGTSHTNAVLDVLESDAAQAPASRRDFLKLFGFSIGSAAILSSCEKPVQKAIPYLIRPEELTPGKAAYYASTFFDGNEYASVLVKTRDGRPIKIEGNPDSPLSRGGTSARIQASVLNLYDDARLKEPSIKGKMADWETMDEKVRSRLSEGGRTVLITPTIISPTFPELLRKFADVYPNTDYLPYDEISAFGIRKAHEEVFGKAVLPFMDFGRARYILSFGADFLGTWLAPVEFARDYAKGRGISKEHPVMSKHIQVEAGMSMTGTNADERIPLGHADALALLGKLYNGVARATGHPAVSAPDSEYDGEDLLEGLLAHRGSSLLISGSNDPEEQKLVAGINYMLGNYGKTLDMNRSLQLKKGDDHRLEELIDALEKGEVDNLLMVNVNPAYSLGIDELIARVPFSVFLGTAPNESAAACGMICPDHHYLESWGDAEAVTGSYSLQQPCIHPIFNTRSWQDSLLAWAGETGSWEELVKYWWTQNIAGAENRSDASWWERTLQKGYYEKSSVPPDEGIEFMPPEIEIPQPKAGLHLHLYPSVGLLDGRYANNPWLQELPDPVTKVCWDNYLAVSPADAEQLGLSDEMLVKIDGVELPVIVQPGQARGTLSLALGYGRKVAGKVGNGTGVNAYPWVRMQDACRSYVCGEVDLELSGGTYVLARTQTHHSMEERPIVREASLEAWKKDPSAGNHFHLEAEAHHQTLYPEAKFDGFHWGLVVDLNKCTGCNNCVVSCIAENNIAVVGKEEVKNRRIMHWMRIDRYFGGEPENPRVYHQPLMCQHCDNAPCENVCPVSATLHSNEGLNQVAYVRCIGTKYCINNCPYRVRRFNWYKFVKNDAFDFNQNSDLGRLVLNPDVTVRERGVVEKCSMCVQRIQEKKMEAKLEGRPLRDGEVQPACVQSCPSGALVFGNMNDPDSRISLLKKDERNYHLLEQLHTLPSVGYLTKIRNTDLGDADGSGQGKHDVEHGNEEHGHS